MAEAEASVPRRYLRSRPGRTRVVEVRNVREARARSRTSVARAFENVLEHLEHWYRDVQYVLHPSSSVSYHPPLSMKTPSSTVKTPHLTCQDPLLHHEDPLLHHEDPRLYHEDPILYYEDPFLTVKTPSIYVKTPCTRMKTPSVLVKTPWIGMKSCPMAGKTGSTPLQMILFSGKGGV